MSTSGNTSFAVGDRVLYFDPDDEWCQSGRPVPAVVTRSLDSGIQSIQQFFGCPRARNGTYDIEFEAGSGLINVDPRFLSGAEGSPA